ncbi:MAG: Ig-like domain-containing protein [Blastocatellia bacterium]|nr:Ig-like domain-containing protein [Blastocatellia bacterium]
MPIWKPGQRAFLLSLSLLTGLLILFQPAPLSGQSPTYQGKVKTAPEPHKTTDHGEIALKRDSDSDGIPDEDEIRFGLNPNDPRDADLDADHDGLTNLEEFALHLNPLNPDTDGDGIPDGAEMALGTDPLDRNNRPVRPVRLVNFQVRPPALSLTINPLLGTKPVQITATGMDSNGNQVDVTTSNAFSYSSQNPKVATVTATGMVLAHTSGTTTISVRHEKMTASIPVTVTTATPKEVGFLPFSGSPTCLAVTNQLALIGTEDGALRVIDLTVPEQPNLVGTVQLSGFGNDLVITPDQSLAFLAHDKGVDIVNLAVPAAPHLVASLCTGAPVKKLARFGSYLYLAGPDCLQIVKVEPPAEPVLLKTIRIPTEKAITGLLVAADQAILAVSGGLGITFFDLTLPATPEAISQLQVPGGCTLLGALGTTVLARPEPVKPALKQAPLVTVTIADPQSPKITQPGAGFAKPIFTGWTLQNLGFLVLADPMKATSTTLSCLDMESLAVLGKLDLPLPRGTISQVTANDRLLVLTVRGKGATSSPTTLKIIQYSFGD